MTDIRGQFPSSCARRSVFFQLFFVTLFSYAVVMPKGRPVVPCLAVPQGFSTFSTDFSTGPYVNRAPGGGGFSVSITSVKGKNSTKFGGTRFAGVPPASGGEKKPPEEEARQP